MYTRGRPRRSTSICIEYNTHKHLLLWGQLMNAFQQFAKWRFPYIAAIFSRTDQGRSSNIAGVNFDVDWIENITGMYGLKWLWTNSISSKRRGKMIFQVRYGVSGNLKIVKLIRRYFFSLLLRPSQTNYGINRDDCINCRTHYAGNLNLLKLDVKQFQHSSACNIQQIIYSGKKHRTSPFRSRPCH